MFQLVEDGPIRRENLLAEYPAGCLEVVHLVSPGTARSPGQSLRAIMGAMRRLKAESAGRPVLLQCGPSHARAWLRFAPKAGFAVKQLRPGPGYPPLDMTERGWTDNEHILMLDS